MTRNEKDERVITVYACGVDWQHELGAASGGNTLHPSLADLKKRRECTESCGVVELEVRLSKWVEKQDLMKGATPISSFKDEG